MACVQENPRAHGWRRIKLAGALAAAAGVGFSAALAMPLPGEAQEPQTFDAPVGLVVSYVRPSGTADFESIMQRLLQALAEGEEPERQQQAEGWAIYKAQEPGPNNQAVYVWVLDPAVGGGDYSVPQVLAEAFPAEAQQLYETYRESFGAGQIWLNLDPVAADGAGGAGQSAVPSR